MRDDKELERLLITRLRAQRTQLQALRATIEAHWGYEDAFYRFYHQSFKVYEVQKATEAAVLLLRELLPERRFTPMFESILEAGTGRVFEPSHNADWERQTRPILEAFSHARHMLAMAVRYSDVAEPPRLLPSGYAALLCLFDLR